MKERLRMKATHRDESRSGDWFIGQLVMRKNPKPSAIEPDFWFGPYLMDSISDNGSVRIMLPDGQTIPVNHRDLQDFIPKDLVTHERMMTGNSTSQADTQPNSEPTVFLLIS
jgi:hypothetical protein